MCVQNSKWQIDRPGKNPEFVCNDHLGHMIERLAASAGQNFQFGLQYIGGVVDKVCVFVEAGVHVEIGAKATQVEPIKRDVKPPLLQASASAEVLPAR